MRTKYGPLQCRWGRWKIVKWIERRECPGCGKQRLLPGPEHDRFRFHCMNCGLRAAFKPPKGAVKC